MTNKFEKSIGEKYYEFTALVEMVKQRLDGHGLDIREGRAEALKNYKEQNENYKRIMEKISALEVWATKKIVFISGGISAIIAISGLLVQFFLLIKK